MKVLILERERIVSSLLSKKLLEQGFEVEIARDKEEGMAKMKKEIPSVVLIDTDMPEESGFSAIIEMKKEETLCNVPIIVISNFGQPHEINKAKELGISDWVSKTEFNPQEIIKKVSQILARASQSEARG